VLLLTCLPLVPGNTTHNTTTVTNSPGTVSLIVPVPVIENEDTIINASISFSNLPIENWPNFTYYYIFKKQEFVVDNWTTIACVQGNNSVSIVSQWSHDVTQSVHCMVELYSSDCGLISNDTKIVRIAGKLSV